MSELNWLKSSFSGDGGNNCLELAITCGDGIALRESDAPATTLMTDRGVLLSLIRKIKNEALIRTPTS